MTTRIGNVTCKAVGFATLAAGLAIIFMVMFRAVPRVLPDSSWIQILGFALPITAFALYVSFLGWALLFRASARAFERIWMLVAIVVVVFFGHRHSFLAAVLLAVGLALLTLGLRPWVTRHLFRDDASV